MGGQKWGENPHFWAIFDVFCPYLKNCSNDFDEILCLLNSPYLYLTPRKKRMFLEKSGSGCTVVARPLFLDFVVFFTFLCDTTL